jgi:histidinol dehydrogenase
MPIRLTSRDASFEADFAALLAMKREVSEEVDAVVAAIIADVRARGDVALIEYTHCFDHLSLTPRTLRVSEAEIAAAVVACDPQAMEAMRFAKQRIEAFHLCQRPEDQRFTDVAGVEMGWRWTAIEAVGLYVPGGTASYPSSVLMNAVPAQVAGCPRIVMVVPTPHGAMNPLVLAAAHLAGVTEVYRIGGAQAVAALAHGTQSIAPVAKIVGPGNAYVAAAKHQGYRARAAYKLLEIQEKYSILKPGQRGRR